MASNDGPHEHGEVPERSIGAVLKTAGGDATLDESVSNACGLGTPSFLLTPELTPGGPGFCQRQPLWAPVRGCV